MFSNDFEKGLKGMFSKRSPTQPKEHIAIEAKDSTPEDGAPMDCDELQDLEEDKLPSVTFSEEEVLSTPISIFASNLEKVANAKALCERAQRIEQFVLTQTSKRDNSEGEQSRYDPPIKRRTIIREWRRDPKGAIMKTSSTGKIASNKEPLWGATVLDFFRTRRMPDCPNLSTITTGSKMLGFCKANGELNHAKDEIAWAEQEASPTEILPYDMATILKEIDAGARPSDVPQNQFHNRIPWHLLPEKLIVHDPDNTLYVSAGRSFPVDANAPPRTYKLRLSTATREAIAAKREEIKNQPKAKSPGLMFVTDPSRLPGGTPLPDGEVPEATFARFPPKPDEQVSTPEAHLYLAASKRLGEGHHSYVYTASWEIPRSWVVEPEMCDACVGLAMLEKLKAEMPDEETNPAQPVGWQIEDLMLAAAGKHGRKGKIWVETTLQPGEDFIAVDEADAEKDGVPTKERVVNMENGGMRSRECYQGGARTVDLDSLQWSVPGKYCEHQPKRQDAPTTFQVEVAAKLSIQHDDHLVREARNYQKFPAHFYEHSTGYNVFPPLHDPTPATALVPQFYGYYEPEDEDEDRYLSPILLVEKCGKSLDDGLKGLDMDDRQECAALFFRLHCEGWVHNSVYPRNVVVDHGNIYDPPSSQGKAGCGPKRFRVIDFGRSEHHDSAGFGNRRAGEEMEVQKLFRVANGLYL